MALERALQYREQAHWYEASDLQRGPFGGRSKITLIEPYVNKAMRAGVFFALGWASSMGYYQVSHLWNQRASLTKEVRCEHTRAQGAIVSAENDLPLSKYVTTDCPHPPNQK